MSEKKDRFYEGDEEKELMKQGRIGKEGLKELIILGTGPTKRNNPWHCECWGVNNALNDAEKQGRKLDRFFFFDEMQDVGIGPQVLNEHGCEVYSKSVIEGVPKSKAYPLAEIVTKYRVRCFVNSIAYMLMLAYHEGYNCINMYGCDFNPKQRDGREKAGIDFLIGLLIGQGVMFRIPKDSCLSASTQQFYGYRVDHTFDYNIKEKDNGKSGECKSLAT